MEEKRRCAYRKKKKEEEGYPPYLTSVWLLLSKYCVGVYVCVLDTVDVRVVNYSNAT